MSHPDALAEFSGALAEALRVEPALTFVEWAERHIRNPDGTPFRFRPHQMLAASRIFDRRSASLVMRWPSGSGKTYLMAAGHAYAVDNGLKVGTCFPSEKQAVEWFRDKLLPIFEATGALRTPVTRDVALTKEFENGARIYGRGLKSPAMLRTMECDWVNVEECDGVERSVSDEGDPIAIAERRTRGSIWAIRTVSSYPDRTGTSNVDFRMEQSDNCSWYFECARCGEPQPFTCDDVIAPESSLWEAMILCPSCGGLFDDTERLLSIEQSGHYRNRDGEIVALNSAPNPKYGFNTGLHVDAVGTAVTPNATYKNYLHEIAAERHKAEHSPDRDASRKVFINTYKALSYDVEIQPKPEKADVLKARTKYDPTKMLPDGVAVLVGFADIGQHFSAACTLGFGVQFDDGGEMLGGYCWGIRYECFHIDARSALLWEKLDEFLSREYPHPLGGTLRAQKFGIDCGFLPDLVHDFTRPRRVRGVFSVKGSPSLGQPGVVSCGIHPRSKARLAIFGADALKREFFDRYSGAPGAPGPVEFTKVNSAGFDAAFFEGLFESEEASIVKFGRNSFLHYQKSKAPGAPRNEPLDCVAGSFGVRKLIGRASDAALYRRLRRLRGADKVDPNGTTNAGAPESSPRG